MNRLRLFFLKRIKNNKGQSILEFALILPFVFFFIFFHIQLCISYIVSEYTNYVSFMSARTVLTNGHLNGSHIGVVNKYIPPEMRTLLRISEPRLIKYDRSSRSFVNANGKINPGSQFNIDPRKDVDERELGIEIQYRIPVFLPFIQELENKLNFTARTVLGREPFHGTEEPVPWYMADPQYGDSFGKDSACSTIVNDNGC